MKRKEQIDQGGGLWGDDDAQAPRPNIRERTNAHIEKMPQERRKLLYGVLVAVVAILFIAMVACGAFIASQQNGSTDAGKDALYAQPNAGGSQAEKADLLARFIDTDNLEFLAEESLYKFMDEFSRYLDAEGYEASTTVKVWSVIERDGEQYLFYASASSDGQFFSVNFNAKDKTFEFAKTEPPADLPELHNGTGVAQAPEGAAEELPPEGQGAAEPTAPDPDPEPVVTPAPEIKTCALTDTSELATVLPASALEYLPKAITEYMAAKGHSVSAEDCRVNLASITVANSSPYFEVICSDSAGNETTISCEWDQESSRFGIAVIG